MKLAADSLFMSNPDPMWIYDLETLRFLAVNTSAIAKYGYTRQEFLAMTIADIRPAEDRAALARNVAAVTEGRSESGSRRHCLKSGEVIHVDITGHTITHDGRRAKLIAARDVSRLIVAEQTARAALAREEAASRELARTNRLLEIAGTSAKFGAWRYGLHSHQVEWSSQTACIHDEPEGVSLTAEQSIAYYAPEYRDRIETLVTACLHDGTPFAEDLEIINAKGRRIWVRMTGEPERDDVGRIVAVQGSIQDISERIAAQQAASELSDSLVETLESISDAFCLLDDDWRFIFMNAQAERLLQCQREDILGKVAWDEFPQAAERIKPYFERAGAGDGMMRFVEYYPALETWFEINANQTPRGLAVYFRDITEQRARDEQLRLLDVATSHLNDILLITEAEPIDAPDGPRIVYVNDAFERRTEYSRDEVIGKTPRILQGPKTQRDELDRIRRAMEKWKTVRSELINYTKTGEEFWLELEIVPVADKTGWFTHWVAIERDITKLKQAEQELKRLAYQDPLTALNNRLGFTQAFRRNVARRGWNAQGVVALLDMRNMRNINDIHGYDVGDQLLMGVARRLEERLEDGSDVGRISGDRFIVFLPDADTASPTNPLDKLASLFLEPIHLSEFSMDVELCYGYTVLGDDERDPDALIHEVEIALDEGRRANAEFNCYDQKQDWIAKERIKLAEDLRLALERDQFELHYQPQVDLATGEVIACEALIRWMHPERGMQLPGQFIGVAEQSKLIIPIGNWVLFEACRHLREWQDAGLAAIKISLNVSVEQLRMGDFPCKVRDALETHDIDPAALTLEITESLFSAATDDLRNQLDELRAMGVRISLDDFGTGYSSLLYLQQYPFDEIKIDMGFVRNLLDAPFNQKIVTMILGISWALSADTVAEGVENESVRDALLELGCKTAQGYHYSMPLEVEDFRWVLEQSARLPLTSTPSPDSTPSGGS